MLGQGFYELNNFKYDAGSYPAIASEFNICARDDTKTPPIPDFNTEGIFQALIDEVVDLVAGAAQTNYPDGTTSKPGN